MTGAFHAPYKSTANRPKSANTNRWPQARLNRALRAFALRFHHFRQIASIAGVPERQARVEPADDHLQFLFGARHGIGRLKRKGVSISWVVVPIVVIRGTIERGESGAQHGHIPPRPGGAQQDVTSIEMMTPELAMTCQSQIASRTTNQRQRRDSSASGRVPERKRWLPLASDTTEYGKPLTWLSSRSIKVDQPAARTVTAPPARPVVLDPTGA